MRGRVKTHVKGFDDELGGGVPQGQVALVRGSTGTMKSSLAYSILYYNALEGHRGLYVTLEQDAASLLSHMAALGLRPAAVSDGLPILDLSRGREHLEALAERMTDLTRGRTDRPMTAILQSKLKELRGEVGFDLLAIDSWDALQVVLEVRDRRRETFDFFEWMRELGCTTFLITEVPKAEDGLEEEFLADAIFRLRLEPISERQFQRRIQCSKMRSADHSSDFYTLVFEGEHFEIARAIS